MRASFISPPYDKLIFLVRLTGFGAGSSSTVREKALRLADLPKSLPRSRTLRLLPSRAASAEAASLAIVAQYINSYRR